MQLRTGYLITLLEVAGPSVLPAQKSFLEHLLGITRNMRDIFLFFWQI